MGRSETTAVAATTSTTTTASVNAAAMNAATEQQQQGQQQPPQQATREQLWEWLAETEDKLEEAVRAAKAAREALAGAERKAVSREMLVSALQRDVFARDEAVVVTVQAEAAAETLRDVAERRVRRAEEELSKLRALVTLGDEAQRAGDLLLHAAQASERRATSRAAELAAKLAAAEAKLREETTLSEERRQAIEEWVVAYAELEKRVSAAPSSPPPAQPPPQQQQQPATAAAPPTDINSVLPPSAAAVIQKAKKVLSML